MKEKTKQWSEFLRVKRERVAFLVKWTKENGVDDYERIYEKARSEFPMASKENTHSYAEAALKIPRNHSQMADRNRGPQERRPNQAKV